jgi:hypothetical protein
LNKELGNTPGTPEFLWGMPVRRQEHTPIDIWGEMMKLYDGGRGGMTERL